MSIRPAASNDEAIVAATGRPWAEWLAVLREAGAEALSHADIARRLHERHGVPGWWAQNLTVRFEQEIGRRVPGQGCSGDFQASASATRDGDLDAVFAAWIAHIGEPAELDGVVLEEPPAASATEKWRYWRARLADGGRVAVHFSRKGTDKVLIGVSHEKLESAEAVERWRSFWRARLGDFRP